MPVEDSKLSGFHKLSMEDRMKKVRSLCDMSQEDMSALYENGLPMEVADRMIENVIGTFELPVGIAVNFKINERDYLIPMVIEESSVVAAASYAAKLARDSGGFYSTTTEPVMISQIQITGLSAPHEARLKILEHKDRLLEMANKEDPVLVKFGGGARDIRCRVLDSSFGPYLIAHLLVDCRDAMGANAVNSMAEALAPELEKITGGRVYLRILSNLADHRLARSRAEFTEETLGKETIEGVLQAYEFARVDPYRCATHNKGIMNGVTAVVNATGNDSRAVEAGAHSYATLGGGYSPLTRWEKNDEGNLVGSIEMPVAVGTVGGATSIHPVAKTLMKILDVKSASELGEVIASVGLAQNFAALRALATEGIQKGHMKLHAKNVAVAAGAPEELIDVIAERMIKEGKIKADRALELVKELSE
ncbi:MAG: hydroxymethylglutaryl-CoA reductase, degradative [Thermoplasmata archaeon]